MFRLFTRNASSRAGHVNKHGESGAGLPEKSCGVVLVFNEDDLSNTIARSASKLLERRGNIVVRDILAVPGPKRTFGDVRAALKRDFKQKTSTERQGLDLAVLISANALPATDGEEVDALEVHAECVDLPSSAVSWRTAYCIAASDGFSQADWADRAAYLISQAIAAE